MLLEVSRLCVVGGVAVVRVAEVAGRRQSRCAICAADADTVRKGSLLVVNKKNDKIRLF